MAKMGVVAVEQAATKTATIQANSACFVRKLCPAHTQAALFPTRPASHLPAPASHRDLAEALLAQVRRPEDALHAQAQAEHLGDLQSSEMQCKGEALQAAAQFEFGQF